jgi:hypothetical protein
MVSMLRTIELIVGLPPLTQFEAAATPMANSFSQSPDLAPYDAITPSQSLTEVNSATAPMAGVARQFDFTGADKVPADQLNASIWKSVKGPRSRMPRPVHHLR